MLVCPHMRKSAETETIPTELLEQIMGGLADGRSRLPGQDLPPPTFPEQPDSI